MSEDRWNDEVARLAAHLNLSDEALAVAEGFSILPESAQDHVVMLIDDYIAQRIPTLRTIYGNRSMRDQRRFNAIVERIQDRRRGIPPGASR